MAVGSARPQFRFDGDQQCRQQGQVAEQGDQHGQAGEQAEVDGGVEAGQGQDGEAGNDGERGVVHRFTDGAMAALHGGHVVVVFGQLFVEAVDVVNGVIHGDADGDGGNGDGHQVQRQADPAHETQYQ